MENKYLFCLNCQVKRNASIEVIEEGCKFVIVVTFYSLITHVFASEESF